jgi:DNA/RNA-binding domain of Phe-tRNA-synthetase-like protein
MLKQITIGIDKEIFEIAPGYRRAILIGKNIKNEVSNDKLIQTLRNQEAKTRQSVTVDDERLVAWRELFHKLGVKPNKYRPSIDALTRRVLNDNQLPNISTLVDIGTILSLRHTLPCGAHSLNDVNNSLILKSAMGNEKFTAFGSDETETIPAGEIIYTDDDIVATSKWTWRQAKHTIIKPETTAFEFNIDALSVISDSTLNEIIKDAKSLIEQFLHIDCDVLILDAAHPSQVINIAT